MNDESKEGWKISLYYIYISDDKFSHQTLAVTNADHAGPPERCWGRNEGGGKVFHHKRKTKKTVKLYLVSEENIQYTDRIKVYYREGQTVGLQSRGAANAGRCPLLLPHLAPIAHPKHVVCVEVILFLFPDAIFHLTPNYEDLVKRLWPGEYPVFI